MEAAEQLVVNRWLASVDEYKASDLLLSVGNPPTLRIQGRLFALPNETLLVPDLMQRIGEAWTTPEQAATLDQQREVSFGMTMPNRKRFKITIFYQSSFLSISLRLVPDRIPPLTELGLPPAVLQLADAERGLLIVCGPFGSGRTTTVSAIVNFINANKTKHIVTIEDPIEFQFIDDRSIIEQREVGTDIPAVDSALAHLVNEDTDVVVVSTTQHPDTLKRVMELIASGRFVILTLNTHSSVNALEKIIHSYPSADQASTQSTLAHLLVGVINQRIVPTIGGEQRVIAEVLLATERVRSTIQAGELDALPQIMQTDQVDGLVSLDQTLGEMVRRGEMSRESALAFALDQKSLLRFMDSAN